MTMTPEPTMPRRPIFDEVWGERFQLAVRAYIESLEHTLSLEGVIGEEDTTETLSGLPYDGCSDCYERESWLMAVALAIQGYEAGEVRLEAPEQCTGGVPSLSPPSERCSLELGHEGPCE